MWSDVFMLMMKVFVWVAGVMLYVFTVAQCFIHAMGCDINRRHAKIGSPEETRNRRKTYGYNILGVLMIVMAVSFGIAIIEITNRNAT